MRKFSGTDTAGANLDFAGMTCDAFAHFTLVNSGLEFVPVDIQVFSGGVPAANTITLLDIMAHSKLGTMGLSDNGCEGMKVFCMQHKCNSICKKLRLSPSTELISEIDNIELEGYML
ncbi:kinase-like domain-containing protein [Cyathus striatus]|nr:kinase-like domain-containing protein [Cyathus striatus]